MTITIDPRRLAFWGALAVLLLLPVAGVPYDVLNTGVRGCEYLVVALSLVLLTGLIGQISLCQATLVGVGGFTSALAVHQLGLHFPFVLLVGMAAGAVGAALIGVVALRVRGLFFAVATLIFAFVGDRYLFVQPWFVGSQSGTAIKPETIGRQGTIPFLDLSDAHNFFYVALAAAVFSLYAVANLRDSKLGRSFAAVRGSEVAAASLGVDIVRTKLLGFAAAGALAGLGGSLILVGQQSITPDGFTVTQSLFYLSIAVVGGLRSLGGAIASSALFAILVGEVFYRFPTLADYLDMISAVLLVVVLLFFRGGLGALAERIPVRLRQRHAVDPAYPQAAPDGTADETGAAAEAAPAASRADLDEVAALLRFTDDPPPVRGLDGRSEPVLLRAEQITVQFGGLTAVDDAGLQVGAGEIVGLIGPNGAGKTTLFNALLGLNSPTTGRVELFGHDVTGWPVHRRAALGVGRTFQVLQLFPDLSVFDNLLVATHLENPTGFAGSLLASPGARQAELAARERVAAVLRLLDLTDVADRTIGGLPFGVLRLVEVARTLVTGARLVCLDEPASGLDTAETERLIEWLRMLRGLGVTLLVIEHDVDMVTRLCDYIYVLDRGRLISRGTPAEIRNDPSVIASYLGTGVAEAS